MNANADQFGHLLAENADLHARLREAQETLSAIQRGEVDALVVGNDIYTLDSAHAASNALRKDVLSQMEDAVLAFDGGQHVIFMNHAAERQYGISASAALGRPRAAVYSEDWASAADEAAAQAALLDGGSYRAQSVHRLAGGGALHVEASVSTLRDADGLVTGHLAVIRDVSQRVQAEHTLREATAALTRRERQFASLVENSPDIFARLDRNLRHVYVSPIAQQYTGIAAAQYLGKTNDELGMPPKLCGQWNAELQRVFATGEVGRIKFRFATVRGEDKVFESRLMPEFADGGSVESVLSIAADVTEQEAMNAALVESQARLQFTLDSARIGEWELDLATDVARHSLQHDRCFGYSQPVHPWGAETFLQHVHPEDRDAVAALFRHSVDTGEKWHFECRVVWPDASVHWIEAHGSLDRPAAGKPQRMLGIVVDCTERKQAEAALHDADRRKDEFLATLAHELRNPLAPIRNALRIMGLSPEPAVHVHARTVIERQLRQMVHLVDDLMDVSRISQGKVELRREVCDLAGTVHTAVETSRPLIDAGRHRLTVQLPAPRTLMVDADVTRLTQIIANLLNNAAKYTSEGGRIELTAERDGDHAVISVQDSGVGIPPEMLPRVFDMFAQVDRTLERAQGGLGIGLALVKRLTELHGGTVQASSAGQGTGCRFVVRLPLTNVPADKPAPGAVLPADAGAGAVAQRVRLLVVDDNVDSAESLAELLRIVGYDVRTAHDGVDAVHLVQAFQPAMVLMDIGLPRMNGHDAARAIRSGPGGQDLLLVALSGWGQDTDRRKSMHAGFDHHLVKPVDIDALTALLAAHRPP